MCFENIDKKSHAKFLLHFSSLSTQRKFDLCKYSIYMHIRTYMDDQQQPIQSLEPSVSVPWLVGWLVGWLGTNCFRFIPITTWGWVGGGVGCSWIFTGKRLGTWRGVGPAGFSGGQQFFGQTQSSPSLVVYDGFLLLESYRIQENLYKGKIVCCVATLLLNHHSI